MFYDFILLVLSVKAQRRGNTQVWKSEVRTFDWNAALNSGVEAESDKQFTIVMPVPVQTPGSPAHVSQYTGATAQPVAQPAYPAQAPAPPQPAGMTVYVGS